MTVNSTSSVNADTQTATNNLASLPSQVLSQDDFLKLLVAQMTSQDPMNPIDNQDMLTQMVQFSTLQGNSTMQSELAQMQSTQQLAQANSLLGKQVLLQVDSSNTAQGVVSGVDLSSGTAQIVVNGTSYDLGQVLAIAPAPASP